MSISPSVPPPPDRSSNHRRTASLATGAVAAVRSHVAVSILLGMSVLAWLVFCLLVAMPPWAVVLLPLLVAVLTVVLLGARRRRVPGRRVSAAGVIAAVATAAVVTLLVIQLVPYGRDRSTPPITGEPAWANDETRVLMVRACFGCHSSEVEYPAYASVAPISWMVQSHIDEGREKVNYSQFATGARDADETIEVILDGEMPPSYFTRFGRHPEARLSDSELSLLLDGLRDTPGMGQDR